MEPICLADYLLGLVLASLVLEDVRIEYVRPSAVVGLVAKEPMSVTTPHAFSDVEVELLLSSHDGFAERGMKQRPQDLSREVRRPSRGFLNRRPRDLVDVPETNTVDHRWR